MNEPDQKIVDATKAWLESLGDSSPGFRRSCGAPTIAALVEIIERLQEKAIKLSGMCYKLDKDNESLKAENKKLKADFDTVSLRLWRRLGR